MASKESSKTPRGRSRVRGSTVRIEPGRAKVSHSAEIHVEHGWVHVAVAAPDIREGRFRYRVKDRYLLVWADGSPHGQHHFVILPRHVDPNEHKVAFSNGVVDARIKLRAAKG